MLRAKLDVNGENIGTLTCQNIGGSKSGWCTYRCKYGEHEFTIKHYRPSGAPALIATAMGKLAEAGR